MAWNKFLGSIVIGTGFVLGNTAWSGNLVVFEAKGAGLKAGQVIDSTHPLVLADGESASLIADTGRIIHLKGPHKGPPLAEGNKNDSVKEAMASLVDSGSKEKGALGATRSADSAFKMAKDGKTIPDPWMIDITQGGNHCYQENKPLVFWRPDSSTDTTIRVVVGDNAWKAHTEWPKGKDNLMLPANVPLQNGINLTTEMDSRKTESVLHVVPNTITSDPVKMAWMHEKGCKTQFMVMLNTVER